jgi:protein-S-isoprenylcysteine O-methyltransferase Ste14
VLFASWFVISANWFLGAAAAVVMLFLLVRTRREEALLIERFGDQYRAYMRTTGRFLPRIT